MLLFYFDISVDTTPPQINGCPDDIQARVELGTSDQIVTWPEPTATDMSGTPSRTRSTQPGTSFSLGVSTVYYNFTDSSQNVATCTFTVTLGTGRSIDIENIMLSIRSANGYLQ